MESRESGKDRLLTNEKLKDKFKSQFELVGYAINLVDNMVRSGRAPRVKSTIENPAVLALEEILQGKDVLESLPDDTPLIPVVAATYMTPVEMESIKTPEKKKSRRILQ